MITLGKQHGLFRVFTQVVEIPVADEEKSVEEIQATGFAEDEIWKHFLAWNILSRTIKGKTDNDILRRVTSPTAAWRILVGSYSTTTRGAKLQSMKTLANRRVKPSSNQIHTLSEMADGARDLRANGTDIWDEIVCFLFLQVLPEEYDVFRQIIEREKEPLTIDGLMSELRARFNLSRKVKPRSSDSALVTSGSRRGKRERLGAKRKMIGKKQSSNSGDISADSATTSGKEDRNVSCSICKKTGHIWFKCSQRVCSICRETGHDPHRCPQLAKENATLVISDQADLVAHADAFVSISQGGHEFRFGCSGGTEGLDCEIGDIETWIVDSAATRHMTPNPVSLTNYCECDGVVRVANGFTLPIEGVSDILMSFQSDFGETDLQLFNVAFVHLLSHNFLSLVQFTRRAGHSYHGDGDGVTLFCKSGRCFFAPTVGKLDQMRGYRTRSDSACATIAPAVKPPNIDTEVDIDVLHCSFGHVHKERLCGRRPINAALP